MPQRIIDDFKNAAVVSDFTFTTEMPSDTLLNGPVIERAQPFKVTIKIEAAGDGITYEQFNNANEALQNTPFTRSSWLGLFRKKKGMLKDNATGKTTPFTIGNDFEIQPMIQLSKYVDLTGGQGDFDLINDFCFQLLENIKEEIYLQNAIQER